MLRQHTLKIRQWEFWVLFFFFKSFFFFLCIQLSFYFTLMFIDYARHCAEQFTCIISFNLPINF